LRRNSNYDLLDTPDLEIDVQGFPCPPPLQPV
jgi:hypothetical protein